MKMEVIETVMVTPSEETPRHTIWLSNIDIPPIPKEYTPTVCLYRPTNGDPNFFSVETLKASLSKALVHFYPMAGRLEVGQDGRTEINCSGDGALFVVVRSESSVDEEFNGFIPSPEMRKALVPPAESAEPPCMLLMVQVTFFKGGEVTLGIANHHTPQDGYSAMNFINTWSEIARTGSTGLAIPPFFDRKQLRARLKPIDCIQKKPDSDVSNTSHQSTPAPFITTILHFSPEQLTILKKSKRMSTFQAVTCQIWRSVCIARNLAPEQNTRLYTFINMRSRLNPPLPMGYFGNAAVPTFACANVGEILTSSIDFGVEKIRDAIAKVDDEYVRHHIDCLEVGKDPLDWGSRDTDITVTSWLGMPIHEADFGWGTPELMVRADMPVAGFGYILDRPEGSDGGVSVIIALETENMEKFQKAFLQLA